MQSIRSTDILTESVSACIICGEKKRDTIYKELTDRLFNAPGKWTLKKCAACNLVYLDPCPSREDVGKTYTNTYAGRKEITHSTNATLTGKFKYAIKMGFLANSYRYKTGVDLWQRILAFPVYLLPFLHEKLIFTVMGLPFIKGGRLLDVGCGVGGFLKQMSILGWQAEGVDTDHKVVQICRSNGLMVREGTLEDQGYPDGFFDVVTMRHVIEHVRNPIELIKECKRILKPDGKLVILTPNFESLAHRTFRDFWLGLDVSRHMFLFTAETLSEAIQKGGLKVHNLSTTCRISEFIWLVSYNLKEYGKNIYFVRAKFLSRFRAKIFGKKVRVHLLWDRTAGDELMLIAMK